MFVYMKNELFIPMFVVFREKKRIKSDVESYLLKKNSRNLHTFRICKNKIK